MTELTVDDGFDGRQQTTPWSAVTCLSLLTFLLVGLEFMPVESSAPIAQDLSITEGQAGLAIAVSGFFAVVTSLFGNRVWAHWTGKRSSFSTRPS